MYIDKSVEISTLDAAVLIGVGVAVLNNSIINMTNGVPFWYGKGKAGVLGGIQGAISFGIISSDLILKEVNYQMPNLND